MHTEDNFLQRRAELSAAKQALLDKRLLSESMPDAKLDAIPRRPPGMVSSLSFAQQRLWFLQQLEPESTVYNEAMAIRLKGLLNVEAITQAAQEIIRRHEVLRSTFPMVDGQVIQVVHPSLDLHVPFVDLRGVPLAEREAVAQRRIAEEVQRPFYLAEEVPWRRLLLRLDEEEHIAVTILHHIVTDAWSMEVFVRELTTLYAAFCAGQPSPLPELPLQYADYANWQRQWLEKGGLDEQLVYWKQRLGGTLPILELPTNSPRPTVQTYRGQRHLLMVPKPLSQKLLALSRQEGATLFMTLLAAFNVLLYRYSLQEDLLVGSPIANRTRAELEGLLGCFVNTLVLRTDLSGRPSFRELLKRVREGTLEAYDHQDVPFEKLVEELQPARSLSHSPLFQVMFVLQNVPLAAQDLAGLAISICEIENKTAKFDLSLCLQETAQGLSGFVEYNTDLFDAPTIERMQGHFLRLLEGIVADPGQSLLDLPLLLEEERQQVLEDWNATEAPFPAEQSLLDLFEAQVQRSPHALAVVYGNERQTYQQLQQQAHRLACCLREQRVGPETLVALLAERSPAFLSSLLAVFQLGGAYLPLDPQHPVARLRQVVRHSGCRLVLVSQGLLSLLTEVLEELPGEERPAVLCLEEVLQQPYAGEQQPLVRASYHGQQLAYVIYTSGSTGVPKGVMVEQAGMLNHLWAKIAALELKQTDRVAQTASSCFDISVWQLLAALVVGGCVHIVPEEVAHDPRRLLGLLEREQLSILETVPSLLRIMLEELEAASEAGEKPELAKLRWLMPTGEALATELCRRWLALYPRVPLVNAYGPTECSDDVTHQLIRQVGEREGASMPIGRPLGNLRLYVLDEQREPVPIGVRGEVYVGGVGVGRGYVGEPERTAQSYVPDGFGGTAGGRLYRTGDVGRYREDGTLEYLGRLDQQVKLRGYRIELEEIEAVLERYVGVRQCVVLLREEVVGNQRLVAYVVAEGQEAGSQALWQYAREQLPAYMVPGAFVFQEVLPLTANGKIDRRALSVPDESRAIQQEAYVAPRSLLEEQLAGIWSQLLGLERISIHDNFFEVGGHSLLITQVVARIRDTFQVELPLRTFFKAPTIAELAETIVKMKARSDELRKPSVAPVSREAYRFKRSYLVKSAGSSRVKTEG